MNWAIGQIWATLPPYLNNNNIVAPPPFPISVSVEVSVLAQFDKIFLVTVEISARYARTIFILAENIFAPPFYRPL